MHLLADIIWCLTVTIAASSALDITDVRLVNGTGLYGGRVEVSINGVWGTICDDSFDMHDANVICRMMNLTASTFVKGARFGQGKGPIHSQQLHCSGLEGHQRDCSFVANGQCTHARDVGIICSQCSDIVITNRNAADISADGTILSVNCGNGVTTSTCMNGIWSPPSIICKNDIRLVNGIGLYDGRIELFMNGIWGTLCSRWFARREAKSICNILFGTSSFRRYYTSSDNYGQGIGPIHITHLECHGSETNINECSYSRGAPCTNHYEDAAVACWTTPEITATRLVNGTGPYDGRIELYVDGHWGTVCNRDMDMYGAQSICNTHNASLHLAAYFTTPIYGAGSGPVLVGHIICLSPKDHINDCHVFSTYRPHCTHDFDLSIVCTSCGLPAVYNGEPFSFNNTELTVKCQPGFFPQYIKMRCLSNGSWVEDQRCTPASMDIADVRLVNGTGLYGGRVEVSINGVWGTICDDSFNMVDARVICRMMNLTASTFVKGARFGQGKGPIYTQQLHCSGLESHLRDCSFVANGQCTHARDVGLICSQCSDIVITNRNAADISADGTILSVNCGNGVTTSTCMNGIWSPPSIICKNDIRLVNGIGLYDGRIELFMNDTWGTLCSTSFSFLESYAICNIVFGTSSSITYDTSSDAYGQGIGPIHIDKLDCQGSSETNINECSYSRDVSCTSHSKDAAVACWITPEITATRLVNGTGPYDGRIELYVDGHWGTVCNRYIDMYDAQTICNTHNKSLAAYFTTPIYGAGSGPVLVGDIDCNSPQDHIHDCVVFFSPFRPDCTHDFDLSIVCTSCGLPVIYNGEPFSFNNTELTVKCQPGFFPQYIKMRCLSNGSWVEDQRCTSYNAYPLNISDMRLAGSFRLFKGRVEFLVNGTWGTVCDTDFELEDATVVCRMLGLEYRQYYTIADEFVRGTGTIFVDRLNCRGTENHINSCTYEISNHCTHYDDVAVICSGLNYPLNIAGIRLAEGPHPSSGRVEIKSAYTWGTVCDDNFGMAEANVICNMIGFPHAVTFYQGAYYGEGKGPIFVYNLNCGQDSLDLNDCTYVTKHNCGHHKDISVACTDCGDPTPDNGFINSSSTMYGAVVYVTCEKGYQLEGDANIKCLLNGIWSSKPTCNFIDCGDPTPDNGFINSSSTMYGAVVYVTCEKGYQLEGDANIKCLLNVTWSSKPTCNFIDSDVDGNNYTIIIIISPCIVVLAIIVLVAVIIRRKRKSKRVRRNNVSSLNEVPGKRVKRNNDSSLNEVPGKRVKRNNVPSLNEVPGRCQTRLHVQLTPLREFNSQHNPNGDLIQNEYDALSPYENLTDTTEM